MRESKSKLLFLLSERLSERGFKYFKSHLKYRRDRSDRSEIIWLTTTDWPDSFLVNMKFEIRLNAVEDIINNGMKINKGRRWTVTAFSEYGYLAGMGYKRWDVADTKAVENVVASMVEGIDETGETWFNDFNSIQKLYPYLLSEDREICRLVGGGNYRSYATAVVISKMLSKPQEETDQIINEKRKILMKHTKPLVPLFDGVIDIL